MRRGWQKGVFALAMGLCASGVSADIGWAGEGAGQADPNQNPQRVQPVIVEQKPAVPEAVPDVVPDMVHAKDGSSKAAKLDPRDPAYVRCRRFQETGSLVKAQRICKTNAEWAAHSQRSNKEARDLVERNRAGIWQPN